MLKLVVGCALNPPIACPLNPMPAWPTAPVPSVLCANPVWLKVLWLNPVWFTPVWLKLMLLNMFSNPVCICVLFTGWPGATKVLPPKVVAGNDDVAIVGKVDVAVAPVNEVSGIPLEKLVCGI